MKGAAFLAMAVAVIATAALEMGSPPPAAPAASSRSRVPPSRLASQGPATTHGDIAMRNLEGDLVEAMQRVAEEPLALGPRLQLAGLVYQRARVTGDLGEMARAVAITDECVRLHPEASDAWLTRASQEQTLHRFAAARGDLARARALWADEKRVAGIARELDWNAGLWGPAAASIREEARAAPSVSSLTRLGRLEHDLGRHAEADVAYGKALALVDETGPVPVAMLELQRGVNLYDAGRLEEAVATFRAASMRLPKYVAAKEHLAETLHRLGRDAEAIALYEEITKVSNDPEFLGALGALYRAQGRVAEADALRARATARYDALLATYPEAMAWHAAEFFAGEGADPVRARALLRQNVELRPNPESLDALARLERAAGSTAGADDLTRRAASIRASASPL